MQSLRLIGRTAPRVSLRLASLRSISSFSRSSLLQHSWQSIKKPSYPAFSTSTTRRDPAGESDQVLSEKFNHERQLELEASDPSKQPPPVEEFIQNGPWSIVDKAGTHDVELTRDFGNEKIKVEFSITDMHDYEDGMDEYDEDGALEDEDFEQPKRTINQAGVSGGKIDVAPEDSVAPADRDGEADEDGAQSGMSYPLNLLITIQKPGDQALVIRAAARDGTIVTEHINYYPKSSLIDPSSPQDTAESGSLYSGPPFENLDTDLQLMFENYLEERGVNAELANILPQFVEWKEQREYVDWLQNMKKFIDA